MGLADTRVGIGVCGVVEWAFILVWFIDSPRGWQYPCICGMYNDNVYNWWCLNLLEMVVNSVFS